MQPDGCDWPCGLEWQIQNLVGFSNDAVQILQRNQVLVLPKLKRKYCEREQYKNTRMSGEANPLKWGGGGCF
jgi:hypothetical protein